MISVPSGLRKNVPSGATFRAISRLVVPSSDAINLTLIIADLNWVQLVKEHWKGYSVTSKVA